MNITKYSSFTDIMKNIFTGPKNNTHFFHLEKTFFSIKKDNKGSVCDSSSRKDWLIRIQNIHFRQCACPMWSSVHSSKYISVKSKGP